MSLLFAILVVLGFLFWLLETNPRTDMPAWPARLCWFIAALLWAWPVLRGLGG